MLLSWVTKGCAIVLWGNSDVGEDRQIKDRKEHEGDCEGKLGGCDFMHTVLQLCGCAFVCMAALVWICMCESAYANAKEASLDKGFAEIEMNLLNRKIYFSKSRKCVHNAH